MLKVIEMGKKLMPHYGSVNFERRKHPRFSLDLPVEYWHTDSTTHLARTADVSEGGLLLYVSDEMHIGQKLGIKLFIDAGLKLLTLEAEVEVVWKDFRLAEKGYFRVGVKFVHISLDNMEKLKNYLNTLINSKTSKNSNFPSELLSSLASIMLGGCSRPPDESK